MNLNKLIYDWSSEQYADRNNLVFEGKNKAYGAYQIRREYNHVLLKSMFAAFFGIAFIISIPNIIQLLSSKTRIERELPEDTQPQILDPNLFLFKPEVTQIKERLEIAKVPTEINVIPKVVNKPLEMDPSIAVQEILEKSNSGTTKELGTETPFTNITGHEPEPIVEIIEDNTINTIVGKMPIFGNGDDDLLRYMKNNIKYPDFEKEVGISGTVYVYFVINKQGKVEDARIVRGVKGGKGLETEALRVIKSMPTWEPGMQNGQPAKVQFTYPVSFLLR
jgi:protein TonB